MKLKIHDVVRETEDAISIYFKQPFFSSIKYKPGQFLTLIVEVGGKEYRRAYSINTTPEVDKMVSVTIKRIKDGVVSNKLFECAKPGESLKVMKPMGNFVFEAAKGASRHLVLFGGGSGITPLISIAKSVLYFEPKSIVSLYYANVSEHSVIFKRKLDELAVQFEDRFTLTHIIESPGSGWRGESGRLTAEKVVLWIQNLPDKGTTDFYVCGPTGMMDVVLDGLSRMKVAPENIHLESFTAPAVDPGSAQPQVISFSYMGKEYDVEVIPGKNILDAVLDAGINVPYSCMTGICGTCKCKLNQGEVQMNEFSGLTPQDKEKGLILPCISFPKSADVKIEMI